ncbi:hypothetical protein LRM41_00080 [Candidatus Nanosynbacter sp. TM7-087]|uniref:hypothetical protein n=1 Tax=Candidatus Nanosynbacter sp. TM7-087 TaxID=2902631 RepID=UPI001FB6662F|nr:hypothetical protein [Candidatus Nanosynbacter sp. TM7-087]MCJ1965981.1 hypothetical protein [Candidatus Nanosynbacter sp. TM7-087]
MYPDNLNNQPQGIDYLNQIATPPPAEGFDKKTKIIIAILSFIGLITLIAIFVFSQDSMPSASPSQVASRVNKLLTISKKYNNKFRSTSLQTTNSSLVAVLTTADASMSEALQATGINYKEKQKDILALDPSEKLEKKLDEALLNTQLDITYAHEMNVQITDTINMMKKVYKSTKSKKMREWLVKTAGDLENIQKQINQIIKAD